MFKYLYILFFFLGSCASYNYEENLDKKKIQKFNYEDKGQRFFLKRKRVVKDKKFIVGQSIHVDDSRASKVLEVSVTTSKIGFLKGMKTLRPHTSYHEVWLDGNKYVSKTRVDTKKRKLVVNLKSPEKQWNGKQVFNFPKGENTFCYYGQIIECLGYQGFVDAAIKKRSGIKKFTLIWNGYPYFHEQYENIRDRIFAPAELVYDGTNKEGLSRFSLKTANHIQFLFLNKKRELVRKVWVSQGITMIERKSRGF